MNQSEFELQLKKILKINNIELDDSQVQNFFEYYKILSEENKKYNLTSIKDLKSIILKHFLDSIMGLKLFEETSKKNELYKFDIIDFGCGAGFPLVPYKIYNQSIGKLNKIIFIDSNSKKINFLNILFKNLKFKNNHKIMTLHSRLENFNSTDLSSKLILVGRAVGEINKILSNIINFLFKNKIEYAIFVYYAGPNFIIPENRIVKFYQPSKNIKKTNDVSFEISGKITEYSYQSKKINRKLAVFEIKNLK
tara:strand:+ start:97 stop:849 length:753 start_codon:yes stop_codon:yes gene_type:complete